MKIFIINFNRLTIPRKMAAHLTRIGCEVIWLDNSSTYSPLLEWYKYCEYEVVRFDKNYGHQCLWQTGFVDKFTDRYYGVTDADLDLDGIPDDMINFLFKGLENNPDVIKSGLSLRIDDLPNNPYANEAKKWENKFWQGKKDKDNFIRADIDTTFSIYDKMRPFGELPNNRFFSAVRAPEPYTAKHCPWYNTKESIEGDEEEQYYLSQTCTYWAEKFKQLL